ncbi:MAG: T9SS type A sorting domain-containing protein [Flavobacteriales bacterium]|nr:T9SS type A sorting domain-containing protein [Flavobacteriales bacterium]
MKKLLLLLFYLSTILTASAQLNQPSQFNYFCDDNNDGSATFYMQEISFEIVGNAQGLLVTHHLTQADAENNVNALPVAFTNTSNPQLIFARVTNLTTNDFQIITYNLTVVSPPLAIAQTLTACSNNFQCWDLTSVVPSIAAGTNAVVQFYQTQSDATFQMNPIVTPNCYFDASVPPIQPPVFYTVANPDFPACFSVGVVELALVDCTASGQPQSLTACAEGTDNVCYDLSQNDDDVIGTLDPANHIVTYHISESDALTGANPITANPYCIAQGFQMLYSRIQSNDGQFSEISSFALNGFNFEHNLTPLQTLTVCDDNLDQMVIFDLTTAQAQINTTNTLTYYASSTDAQAEQNPITNPSAYQLSAFQPMVSVFIRETIVGACDVIYSLPLQPVSNCNLASICSQANSLCNALGVPFANTVGTNSSGSAGCLGTTPNPTWFYLPVSSAGLISLQIVQTTASGSGLDVDYIVYGPFTDPITPCNSPTQLSSNIASCSYSAAFIENPIIQNAQPGQYYLLMVTNFSNQPGLITISELGNTQGTIACSGIKLNAFLDANNNGTQEAGEQNFPLGQFQYEMNDNGVVHNIISPTGVYNIYDIVASNTYDVSFSVNSTYASMYNVNPSSYSNISVVIGAGMITYNFPVTVVQPYHDLGVSIVGLSAPRPGFVYMNRIVYTNLGNQNITSGTLTYTKDNNVTITSISQAGTTPTTDGFTYNFTNLNAFETRTIDVGMLVPPVPTVNAGDYLTSTASIEPLTDDVNPENNFNSNSQLVINAYDPNDKMEAHGDRIIHSSFTSSDYLYYTIRFENTGNASAINIRVNDVLDAKLDENSLQMLSTSHPYVLDRVDDNVTWKFDNIQLPVSVANTNVGKGYIAFKIKPKAGYAVGDIIPNAASIYFDFNPPIITNTFTTEFYEPLANPSFDATSFTVHPNPSNEIVFVSLNTSAEAISKVVLIDVLGKIVMSTSDVSSNQASINVDGVSPGIYFVEVTTENGLKAVKKLIVK